MHVVNALEAYSPVYMTNVILEFVSKHNESIFLSFLLISSSSTNWWVHTHWSVAEGGGVRFGTTKSVF